MLKRTLGWLIAGLTALCGTAAWAQKDIPWGTSAVGSSGHRALVALGEVLNREMKDYRVTVQPTPGAIVSVKGYATGQFEGYYGADIAFWEMANDSHRFKGFKAQMKRQPVQSFWAFTVEVGTGVRAKDRDKFKDWKSLSGRPIFTGPLPWDVRAHLERAYQALGVKHQYRQVDLSAAGSLLSTGGIDGFIIYTNSETTTAPWITEASLAVDWAAVNPSSAEIEVLKKAGFGVTEVSPDIFKRNVHVDRVVLLPFYYGFHVGLDVPEQDKYRMLTAIEKNLAELAKADATYAPLAKDMPRMQRQGVEAAVEFVEIHPGLARYMREKGVWDKKWDGRVAKSNNR
jgi:uncharacterized protein